MTRLRLTTAGWTYAGYAAAYLVVVLVVAGVLP